MKNEFTVRNKGFIEEVYYEIQRYSRLDDT